MSPFPFLIFIEFYLFILYVGAFLVCGSVWLVGKCECGIGFELDYTYFPI